MRLTRSYTGGWHYSAPEPTGLTFGRKLQWQCYAKRDGFGYVSEVGYSVARDRDAHNVVVFAKNASGAEREVIKLLKKANKLYK